MLMSYLIIALSITSTLVSGLPAGSHLPAEDPDRLSAFSEPGTLRGRHYTLLSHRAASHEPHNGPASPAAADEEGPSHIARAMPFPKYVADRSEDAWLHTHARRAHGDAASPSPFSPDAEPNYVSHVGPFAYNAAPLPPLSSAAPAPAPAAPTVMAFNAIPASTTTPAAAAAPTKPVSAFKTVKTKAKTHSGATKKMAMGSSY